MGINLSGCPAVWMNNLYCKDRSWGCGFYKKMESARRPLGNHRMCVHFMVCIKLNAFFSPFKILILVLLLLFIIIIFFLFSFDYLYSGLSGPLFELSLFR